jgi:hypothetical protein
MIELAMIGLGELVPILVVLLALGGGLALVLTLAGRAAARGGGTAQRLEQLERDVVELRAALERVQAQDLH